MTTTWSNEWTKAPALGRQCNSDSQALMFDDGASACITNNKHDFIEPRKHVDRKVKGIKGHAKATHRGIIKWHLEDDNGLVHVMVIKVAYFIPDAVTRILYHRNISPSKQKITIQVRKEQVP